VNERRSIKAERNFQLFPTSSVSSTGCSPERRAPERYPDVRARNVGVELSVIAKTRGGSVKAAASRSIPFTVHRSPPGAGPVAWRRVDDPVAEISEDPERPLRVFRAPTAIGGHDVHHGRGSVSRNRRRGSPSCRKSTGSRAASAAACCCVSAESAIAASGFARPVSRPSGVNRFAAQAHAIGSSCGLGGSRRPGRLAIASAGTSSPIRK
jgi:hypothetical protein